MKKRILVALVGALVSICLLGCASKNAVYLKDIKNVKGLVTLGQYKGIEVSATKFEISDSYFESFLDMILLEHATYEEVTDRPVQEGDLVNIDYAGFLKGEQFEGGTAAGYDLLIGSHQFIDGFEDGLIGSQTGDKVMLDLTFPDPYSSEELAGQAVTFEVTVNRISQQKIPELNDEFVVGLEFRECDTVESFKTKLREELEREAKLIYEQTVNEQLVQKLTDESTVTVPEPMKQRYYEQAKEKISQEAENQGIDYSQYVLMNYGVSETDLEEMLLADAERVAKEMLVLYGVAKEQGITVSKEQVQENIAEEAQILEMSTEEYQEQLHMEDYEEYVLSLKVLEYLRNEAVVTEPAELAE